jgi:hypothetical protein
MCLRKTLRVWCGRPRRMALRPDGEDAGLMEIGDPGEGTELPAPM